MPRLRSVLPLFVLLAGVVGCHKVALNLPMRWDGDVVTGLAKAKAENKPVFLFFGADWDMGAKDIEHDTLTDPEVVLRLRRDFVSVHVDLTDEERPGLLRTLERFKIFGEPVVLLLRPDGVTEVARVSRFIAAPELVPLLVQTTRPGLHTSVAGVTIAFPAGP